MMEAASTSEMSVIFYQTTQRNNPEDSHLHAHHYENLTSYRFKLCFWIPGWKPEHVRDPHTMKYRRGEDRSCSNMYKQESTCKRINIA
jgi:hypothetical protein